jgi:YggT family protein
MRPDSHEQENNERRQELRAEEEAFRLQQEEDRLATGKRRSTFNWLISSIYFLVGSLEVLLGLRFLLRLSGANTQNTVNQFITMLSAPFIAPFSTLFVSPVTGDGANIFDLNVLIAMIVYPLLGWLGVRLVKFIHTR